MPETHIHCKGPVLQPLHGSRSRRQNMPEYLQSTPFSQYTREYIAVLHQWADCPASQLLTDDGLAFCLRQYDVTSDMVVQWGIYYYLNQNPCSDPRWCTLQAEQLLNQVRERSMPTMLCYFRGILATTAREDYFEMLYTVQQYHGTKRYGPPDHERSLALDVHGGYGFYKSCCLDPLGFTLLTSRRLSSHSPASARQRLASRDLQFAGANVHCSVARHCWTSTKYTHCDAASSRSFSLHMFCHFAFVRTKLHSDLMTILAPAPQPPAPSPHRARVRSVV